MHDTTAPPSPSAAAAPKRQLTLFDSTCIIVGIIIGATIYESSPLIASQVPNFGWLLAVWLLGGVFAFLGALSYAELATTYPESGGDYVFLTRAFGRSFGFLFAWSELWVVRPGNIGAMAYVFARYANELWPWLGRSAATWWPTAPGRGEAVVLTIYAALAVAVLTVINILGVRQGKWTQNLLTTAKVLGLVAIIVVGLSYVNPQASAPAGPAATAQPAVAASVNEAGTGQAPGFGLAAFTLAMIFVTFAYGGWNEMGYVAAEVRNPQKNILRALLLGTTAVTLIYVLVTVAFVQALGLAGVQQSKAVATEVLGLAVGKWAAALMSLLICISALGAINGLVFTGARIYYAMGTDHRLYGWLGRWSSRRGTPAVALAIQGLITLALVVAFGWLTASGRSKSGFESLIIFTSPAFWFFFTLVGLAIFQLRRREPDRDRPYRVPGYPIAPILFCLASLFMLYQTLSYAIGNRSWEAMWSVLLLAAGVPMCFLNPRRRGDTARPTGER